MKRSFRVFWMLIALPVSCIVVWCNIKIHRTPLPGSAAEQRQVIGLLNTLKKGIRNDVPERMQKLFPEGAAFIYALYGLANCNAAHWSATGYHTRIREARWSMDQLGSDPIKDRFPASLPPGHGIFHAGWSALLHGSIIKAVGVNRVSTAEIERFTITCDTIASTFANGHTPYPCSYTNMAWPADAVVAMAALALYDEVIAERYGEVRLEWVGAVKALSPGNAGIPHAWDPSSNTALREMRGSSLALICLLLPTIDSAFAKDQFTLFAQNFFAERMGVPAVTEYQKDHAGKGDVDSGPLIFGAGPVATIVGAGACRANADAFHDLEFSSTTDGFGFVFGDDERGYLFGAMPIADLFIAWCRSMPVRNPEPIVRPKFIRFHAWSTLLLALLWSPLLWGRLLQVVRRP
ncbi:MAG: hypothetical protein IPO87_01750 [Flavobacteriales bacterium]|nr:hypothetical protein [Flavobacteriales bacterium]